MSDERRKPLLPWIAALLIGLPVLYVASFGPACWYATSNAVMVPTVARFYWPLTRCAWACPGDFAVPVLWRYGMVPRQGNFKALCAIFRASRPAE